MNKMNLTVLNRVQKKVFHIIKIVNKKAHILGFIIKVNIITTN